MFIKIPSDAPENYGSVTKTVSRSGDRQGRFFLPVSWISGRVIVYHIPTKEYTNEKRVISHANTGVIYTSKTWIGDEVIAFLVVPPAPNISI